MSVPVKPQSRRREGVREIQRHLSGGEGEGIALSDRRDVAGAISCYRKAIALDPNLAWAHSNLGNALRARKERGVCPCCGVLLKPGQVAKAPVAEAAPVQEMPLNTAIRTIEADIKTAGAGRKESIINSLRGLLRVAGVR